MPVRQIFLNFVRSGYAPIMLDKIRKRLFEKENKRKLQYNLAWCQDVCQEFEILANQLDKHLWQETKKFMEDLELRAKIILNKVNIGLGGGGYYPFLYFITRYFKPEFIVETGVAAGFSTQAFLKAMSINTKGQLYSSDFPYFRLKNPEQYIGILVEEDLKERWRLYIKGDRSNLPQIVAQIPKIDVFHYDSDKTYSGRLFAISMVEKLLHNDSFIIMDDVQDNLFFHDYIKNKNCSWRIFKFYDKYIGVIGRI